MPVTSIVDPRMLDLPMTPDPAVRHLELLPPDARSVDLVHARRIVAAGIGAAGDELLTAVGELADLLDGSVGATRPVTTKAACPRNASSGRRAGRSHPICTWPWASRARRTTWPASAGPNGSSRSTATRAPPSSSSPTSATWPTSRRSSRPSCAGSGSGAMNPRTPTASTPSWSARDRPAPARPWAGAARGPGAPARARRVPGREEHVRRHDGLRPGAGAGARLLGQGSLGAGGDQADAHRRRRARPRR